MKSPVGVGQEVGKSMSNTKRALRDLVKDLTDRLTICEATVGQLRHRMNEVEAGHRLDIPEMLAAEMTITEDETAVIYQFPSHPWKPKR